MKIRFKNLQGVFDLLNENLLFALSHSIILILMGYIVNISFANLTEQIPLFYSLSWGLSQLAPKSYIFLIYYITIFFSGVNIAFIFWQSRLGHFVVARFANYLAIAMLLIASAFIFRIINISVKVPLEIPMSIKLIAIPFFAALLTTYYIGPFIIKLANKLGLIDDPLTHKHPGMLLKKPTPRAGGLVYILGILIPGVLFLPILQSQKLIGILLGAIICVITGLIDDKKDVNPIIRLFIQGAIILITVLSGIILIYIPNPFGNPIMLDSFKISFEFFGPHSIYYFSVLAAAIWIATTMNFMSFANGTDGVYAGLVFVASLVIAIILFQSLQLDPEQAKFIKIAALSAGSAFGMAFFTWPPQKMLWGFGATSAGLIIAALSIIGSTKVAIMLLVLLIPFIDGFVAVVRRLRRGQFPFWGDREHFHHKLLFRLGWNKKQVALFYWVTTILLGIIGIFTSGQARALWVISMIVIFLLVIALINFIKKPVQPINEESRS